MCNVNLKQAAKKKQTINEGDDQANTRTPDSCQTWPINSLESWEYHYLLSIL